jgi:hypothetical protein
MRSALALLFVLSAAVSLAPAPPPPSRPPIAVHPTHVRFGRHPFESNTLRSFTVSNQSSEALLITIEQVRVGDDFSPGQIESTCSLGESLLPAGQECEHVVGFRPSEFFGGHETAEMRVVARDLQGTELASQRVRLSGTGF